jgi:hypothetical protein
MECLVPFISLCGAPSLGVRHYGMRTFSCTSPEPVQREFQSLDSRTAHLTISTSGFLTVNAVLRYRWFDGEKDGCKRATTLVCIPVPGISTTECVGRAMLNATKRGFPNPVFENRDINRMCAKES